MALRGKVPKNDSKRIKMLVYGEAKVGKTVAALQFPNAYIIDTESGTEEYSDVISANNSAVFESTDFYEVLREIKALMTEKHDFRTLVIDPMTHLYNDLQEQMAEKTNPESFGFWGKVKKEYKKIHRLIGQIDMNVITTCHEATQYDVVKSSGRNDLVASGYKPDTMKGEEYMYDFIFRITVDEKTKNETDPRKKKRMAICLGERSPIGKPRFPEPFEWSYDAFINAYGKQIADESESIEFATEEQINEINNIIDVLNVSDETKEKWFAKEKVESFDEMTSDQIQKYIKEGKKKVDSLNN